MTMHQPNARPTRELASRESSPSEPANRCDVSDATSRDPLSPLWALKVVVSAGTPLAAKVLHEVEGAALAEVTLGDPDSSDLHQVFEWPLLLASGQVVIADAGGEPAETVRADPGPCLVRILANDPDHPTRLVIALRRA